MEGVRDERALSLAEGEDDDPPMLSAQALEALKQFLEENQPLADDDGATGANGGSLEEEEVALLAEDWRMSQFWYDRDTALTVAEEILSLCESVEFPSVACVACPTLYAYLKKVDPNVPAQLLEYDKRFEQYGSEFTFYDYNQPEELPSSLKNAYQIVVVDPPYLHMDDLIGLMFLVAEQGMLGECYSNNFFSYATRKILLATTHRGGTKGKSSRAPWLASMWVSASAFQQTWK